MTSDSFYADVSLRQVASYGLTSACKFLYKAISSFCLRRARLPSLSLFEKPASSHLKSEDRSVRILPFDSSYEPSR